MKPLNPIERAAFESMNDWRASHGLNKLRDPDDDQCLGDEEPRARVIDIDRYLDDPRWGQAKELNRK